MTGYVASTWLLMVLRKLGATRYLPRAYWSCAVTGGVGDIALLFAGLLRAVAMVAVLPFVYALIFRYLGRAEVLPGTMIGLVHGAVAGLLLPLAAKRCKGAKAPGLLGWRLGRPTPFVLLVVHAVYGALIGWIYVLPLP